MCECEALQVQRPASWHEPGVLRGGRGPTWLEQGIAGKGQVGQDDTD